MDEMRDATTTIAVEETTAMRPVLVIPVLCIIPRGWGTSCYVTILHGAPLQWHGGMQVAVGLVEAFLLLRLTNG